MLWKYHCTKDNSKKSRDHDSEKKMYFIFQTQGEKNVQFTIITKKFGYKSDEKFQHHLIWTITQK